MNLRQDRTILGFLWFKTFNPVINWHTGVVEGPAITLEVPILKLIYDTGSTIWVKERLKAKDNEQEGNLQLLAQIREQNRDDKLYYQRLIAGDRGIKEKGPVTTNDCE
jgi:hypothetical protein